MDPQPAAPAVSAGRRSRVGQWLASRRVSQWSKAAVAAFVAFTALFGGLDRVDNGATPFAPGEEFSDGQYTVTVDRARLLETIQGGGLTVGPATPGQLYLGVVATLRNDGTIPGRLRDELDLRGVPGERFYGVFRFRDGSPITNLGPGLTEQVVFAWQVPADALAQGSTVTVRVWKKSFKQLMVTYGGKEWLDSLTDYGVTELVVGAPSP
ncbi:hypothetical protein [Mycolicibacterium parafortuitum]|uniref:DUF4352 domain-containing protein n=1 Tax=Mycolicibacterium parafortuitum TaxID=39692 RepID=A0A375YNI0_MYCPF|nr:hypothetical protein [Mycolicibacterium parafortuitum]ORB26168.1 hypothetical protein BST38_26505 [Mycolicibacterium parafortuitum]BBY76960.1 hypothetical protein MPRF_38590 [Mycolicibacterium parafortuitum]SRX82544.1 hypothetical protein MPP7335_04308 [Mycolicibacterium parafortuitum]